MTNGQHNGFHKWSIAWICSFINFLYLGVPRLSGMLYLASMKRYSASRNQASLPFVLCYTMRNVTGPFIGYLSKKVEVRKIIASGCIISAVSVGACFFAENIVTVSVLWGGFFGLGVGLSTILIPCVLNQHFDKYITNANGIAFGGECIAGFILPPIFEFCLSTYGTSGSFLILSGLILHGVPAAMLLKPPKKCALDKEETSTQRADRNPYSITNARAITTDMGPSYDIHNRENYPENEDFTVTKNTCIILSCNEENNSSAKHEHEKQSEAKLAQSWQTNNHENVPLNAKTASLTVNKDILLNSAFNSRTNMPETVDSKDSSMNSSVVMKQYDYLGYFHDPNKSSFNQTQRVNDLLLCNKDGTDLNVNQYDFKMQTEEPSVFKHHRDTDCETLIPSSSNILHDACKDEKLKSASLCDISASHVSSISPTPRFIQHDSSHSSYNEFCEQSIGRQNSEGAILPTDPLPVPEDQSTKSNVFRVFLDPSFILILLTQSSMIFIATTFITIIVDFSKDGGVNDEQTVYVLMCFSIADMLGRFCLGWVTDGGYLSSVAFSSLCYGIMGAILLAVVSFRGFVLVMTAAFVFGLFLGGLIIIGPGVVSAHAEADKINIALASRFCLFGPMSLAQSPMIGYFRDTLGSYNGIFYLLGFHSLSCTLLSLLIPFASRLRERRKRSVER